MAVESEKLSSKNHRWIPDHFQCMADLPRGTSGQNEVGLAQRVLPNPGKDEFHESLTLSTAPPIYRVAAKGGQGSRAPCAIASALFPEIHASPVQEDLIVLALIMNIQPISRRTFLKTSVTAATLVGAQPAALFGADSYGGNKIPFGLQLYSVRNECAKDLVGTVTAVAKMGYKAVEFAGYHGRDAKTLRKLLDDVGLKCCGTHLGLDTLLGDPLAKTVEFNQILGNPFLIVASLPGKYTKTRHSWEEAADRFSEVADQLKPHGMRTGYHNHSIEFKPLDGALPWDVFFNRAKKEVVIQFDTGNGMDAGGDPMVFLKKHPGRVASVHVKPFSKTKPNALIGDDEHPWKDIFEVCETTAGVEWYIIEYESDAYAPLVSVEKTLAVMRRWGKC